MTHTAMRAHAWFARLATLVVAAAALAAAVAFAPGAAFAQDGAVATIGDASYPSIAAAIKASAPGDTIVLEQSTTESAIQITQDNANTAFTIDLNGNTWTAAKYHLAVFVSGADITVENGAMTLNSGGYYAFTVNGQVTSGTFVFDNVSISGGSYGMYLAGCADYALKDCAITAAGTAVEIRNGSLAIDGGTYTSTETADTEWQASGSGTTTWGAAIGVSQHVNTASTMGTPVTLAISDGVFTGPSAVYERNTTSDATAATLELDGGTFNGQVVSNSGLTGFVSGGTYSEKLPAEYLSEGMNLVEVDGAYIAETSHVIGDDAKVSWSDDGATATVTFTCPSCTKAVSATVTVGDGLALTDATVLDILATQDLAASALFNGIDMNISAAVAPAEASEDAAALVAGVLADGETVGQYVDVTLSLAAADASAGISQTAEKAVVAVPVDQALLKTDAGVERTFRVIRIHDGKAEYVDATFDGASGNLLVESDRFSTYVVTYSDKAAATPDAGKSETPAAEKKVAAKTAKKGATGTPRTFDASASLSLASGMTACGAMLAASAFSLRKR
jgi:hypothetical protein